jgi:hypothetical protein
LSAKNRPLSGEEIAYRTLRREPLSEPCLVASWCMKREFFSALTGRADIYQDAPQTAVDAFGRAGANLCPQFIVPSPVTEHIAADPFALGLQGECQPEAEVFHSPEDVRDAIERLPDSATLARDFDLEAQAEAYARSVLRLRDMAHGAILFIGGFGQADFMGGYTRWGYVNYLLTIALYPEAARRYFAYSGEQARLHNLAIVRAVEKYGLAPFVYGGQDICFNDGPIVSLKTLDELYFPALQGAVQPLHEAHIGIIWHCDGDVRPIATTLLERIGVQGFQGFQEETGCTLAHMAGLRTCDGQSPILWGSISVTTTLPFGSVSDVQHDVERCFQTAGPTGFALASTSSILPETPLANILALYEHGKTYGRAFLGG